MADDVKAAIIVYACWWAVVAVFVSAAFLVHMWWHRGEAARSELTQEKDNGPIL